MGHARALLALDGELQIGTAKKVAAKGLSVRETEQLVGEILQPHAKTARPKARTSRDIQRLEEEVSEKLGTSVEIKPGKKGSGRLVINYMSHEHLDDLLNKLTR
jgi:ParB family chromosome partitioning protein